MDDIKEYKKVYRLHQRLSRSLELTNIISGFENKTLEEIKKELIALSPKVNTIKVFYERHGKRWEKAEMEQLIALAESGMLDIDLFAGEYQRKPTSVVKQMKKMGLLDAKFRW